MTVIEGIQVNHHTLENEVKSAIINNDPIEDKLNVIMVISNPCNFRRRIVLAKEFITRMEFEENIELYIVELAYNNEPYYVTEENNKNHLQLRTKTLLWHKENMINLGIKKLLPSDWKAVAWIDADIEFDAPFWAENALKVLNGSRDIVQLFTHCIDMDHEQYAMRIFQSFGFQYNKGLKYTKGGVNYFHPGYAWAMTRKAYEKIGGLYQYGILGSGDFNMALCFLGKGIETVNRGETDAYKTSVLEYEKNVKRLRVGYVPGIIRHYYHGSKINRNYSTRWKILIDYNYNPYEHITTDENGLIVPTPQCPKGMLQEINDYFYSRKEDE